MKSFSALLAALLVLLSATAQAHPGHSPFLSAPHAGHELELALLFIVFAVAALLLGARWFASRSR